MCGLNDRRELDTLKPMSNAPAQGEFAFELVKLLLQVAWADDDVALEEADALLAFGRRSQLSEEQLELLAHCLAGKAPLPPPHFGLLKERRVEVLRAIKELLSSELRVGAAEDAILEQISALLR